MNKREANRASRAADKRLNEYSKTLPKNSEETPEYLRLSREANEAAKKASWWQR